MEHASGGPQGLADLGRVDEVQLEVKAEGAPYLWLQRPHRTTHRRIRKRGDEAAVNETGVVRHLFLRKHLDRRRPFACLDEVHPEPRPGFGLTCFDQRPRPGGTTMHVDDARATNLSWASKTSASLNRSDCFMSTTRPTARSLPSTTGRKKLIFSSMVVFQCPSS